MCAQFYLKSDVDCVYESMAMIPFTIYTLPFISSIFFSTRTCAVDLLLECNSPKAKLTGEHEKKNNRTKVHTKSHWKIYTWFWMLFTVHWDLILFFSFYQSNVCTSSMQTTFIPNDKIKCKEKKREKKGVDYVIKFISCYFVQWIHRTRTHTKNRIQWRSTSFS